MEVVEKEDMMQMTHCQLESQHFTGGYSGSQNVQK